MNTLSAHFVQVAIFIYEKSIMVLSVSMYHPLLKLSLMGFFFAMLTVHKDSKNKVLKKKRTTPDVDV